ncbi:MAG: NUDIX hydrolase, partial [Planctomycetota bacterium]
IGFFSVPGISTEYIHVYLARGLSPARGNPDRDEFIRVAPVTRREALRMVWSGRIGDAKSIAGILAAEHELSRR